MFEIQYVDIEEKKEYEDIINRVVEECFKTENLIDSKMYINIILTTSEKGARLESISSPIRRI